jgi:diketogulonate reductase-like aldo/keto reductase
MNKYSLITLHTGSKMPIFGLGTWKLDNAAQAIESALELGYKMIDTSGDYGTQPGIAQGLRRSGRMRNDYYLQTKVEETDDAYEATRKNLRELQHEYADLMLIHRPPKGNSGEELWQDLIKARQDGYTRDIGVSNYSIEQIEDLIEDSGITPVVNQIEWSPFGHSKEMLDFCCERGIIIQAYSPLTHGRRLENPHILEIAERHNKTPAQVLVRWNIQMGTVPIVKAGKSKHQQENIDVFDFELSNKEMEALNALNETYSALGSLTYV